MFEDYVWDDIYGQRTEDGGDDWRGKSKQNKQQRRFHKSIEEKLLLVFSSNCFGFLFVLQRRDDN